MGQVSPAVYNDFMILHDQHFTQQLMKNAIVDSTRVIHRLSAAEVHLAVSESARVCILFSEVVTLRLQHHM